MDKSIKHQMVISGVGGQGVLFITRLLAETAMEREYPVLTSETHGMAQRGGTVVSHLKTGDFSSPLIRPASADAIIALKPETLSQYSYMLSNDSFAVVNSDVEIKESFRIYYIDADAISKKDSLLSVNLIMLGFFVAMQEKLSKNNIFSIEKIKFVLSSRFADKKQVLESAIKSLEIGYNSKQE